MLCGLALLPLGWKRRRRVLWLGALLLVIAGGVTSCTSAGPGSNLGSLNGGSTSTPAGTYSIPVTAISNGVQHSITVTLVVD